MTFAGRVVTVESESPLVACVCEPRYEAPWPFCHPDPCADFRDAVGGSREPPQSVSNAALANAGRQATLKMIDYGAEYCDSALSVEAWLEALVGTEPRSITWSGGKCVLVNDMRPGIDASSWPYCAQATITLVHPKDRDDGPDDGRFRQDFEALWHERYPPGSGAHRCKDE